MCRTKTWLSKETLYDRSTFASLFLKFFLNDSTITNVFLSFPTFLVPVISRTKCALGASTPLHTNVNATCVLENRSTEITEIFTKVGEILS